MNKLEVEKYYKKYKGMINKMAFFYSKKYNKEYDELKGQANLIFCEALERYEKMKSSFSTYLSISLRGFLKRYIKKDSLTYSIEDYAAIDKEFLNYCRRLEFTDQVKDEVSDSAQIILQYILDNGIEDRSKVRFNKILKHFRNLDWNRIDVLKGIRELKEWWGDNKTYYGV